MTISAIMGMQWGDEGKGKIVDALSEDVALVVRCQGGANAGHTVVLGETVYKLHIVPSGILRDGVTSVIGNGVVVDPLALCEEIGGIEAQGVSVDGRLRLSDRAHLVLPWHRVLDGLSEHSLGTRKIGTTGRGIGPAYADKAARTGLRGWDLRDADRFRTRVADGLAVANRRIEWLGGEPLDPDETIGRLAAAQARLAPLVADTVAMLHDAHAAGRAILMEGAQGTQLDIDFGTYPYVTSSNTTGGGFATGSGLPPSAIGEMHGVFKAFTTRVGEGPFVTELEGPLAERLRGTGENQWDEYGTTTGRPRRVGWLDLVIGRFAARVNGVTQLHITKLDVLTGVGDLQVCTAYELDGERIDTVPADADALARCTPVYETVPGWTEDITGARTLDDLPANARAYVRRILDALGLARGSVSVGPRRDQFLRLEASGGDG
ncbi:MAG: adenylosuccinate synthase [Planctomycetota bacterium]